MTSPSVPTAAGRLGPTELQEASPAPAPRADWRSALAEIDLSLALRPASPEGAARLRSHRLHSEAEAAYRTCLERDPTCLAALHGLSELLAETGRPDEAAAVRRCSFEVEANELGIPDAAHDAAVAYFAAAEDTSPPPPSAPPDYVAALFDRYAPRFERSLVEGLGYRGPQMVVETVCEMLGPTAADLDVLDAGCGTGLAAPLLRPLARRLDGVDLASRMIDRARARGQYDDLVVGDLGEVCERRARSYDLVVAVDVLIYVGRLELVLDPVRRALRPHGRFAFTVERAERPGYELRPTRRYVHHLDAVVAKARAAGFEVSIVREAVLRTEQLRPVSSLIFVLQAAGDEPPMP